MTENLICVPYDNASLQKMSMTNALSLQVSHWGGKSPSRVMTFHAPWEQCWRHSERLDSCRLSLASILAGGNQESKLCHLSYPISHHIAALFWVA